MINIYRAGEFRALTTRTQVMEGTIVVYIKIVDKMISKMSRIIHMGAFDIVNDQIARFTV